MNTEATEKKTFIERFSEIMTPVGNWMANQKHFSSITSGMMCVVGLTLLAAIFQIIANPPVTAEMCAENGFLNTIFGGWVSFAAAHKAAIMLPYTMSMGLMAVTSSLAIAYNLAKKYEMNALIAGIVSMVIFLMISAPASVYELADGSTVNALPTSFLGGQGLFTAILVAFGTVEIDRLCKKYHLEIRMPDSVPPFLSASFSAVIPLLIDVVVFYGATLILSNYGLTIPTAINALISAPLSVVNSAGGVLFIITFAALLWCCGIHGTAIVYPFILPMMLQAVTHNAELVAQGLPAEYSPIFIFGAVAMVGGSGNTLGMVILSCWKAKSKQLKAIGKVGLVPGLFNINEPVLFGMPIMFNPVLMIPFVFGTLLIGILTWIGLKVGLYAPECVFLGASLPIGISGMLASMSVKNLFFQLAMIPVTMVIWYPFFRIYDRQLCRQEAEAEALEAEENELDLIESDPEEAVQM